MRSLLALLVLSITVLTAAGCGGGGNGSGAADAELTAVATTTQLGDMVGEVGGDRVAVEQILEPNSDPHDYEPRPSDAQALADAGVVFQSGGDLDVWLDELIESAGSDGEVVNVLDAVRAAGAEDPHWWQDPRNAQQAVEAIRDALVEADPEGREAYESNASDYLARLDELDGAVADCIEQIPADQRLLVTTHDAIGHYADRYGLEVVGALIPSLSTQAQPSLADTDELVDQIEQLDVRAIFPESSLSPKLEQAVARESGAEVGGALWADTLGPEGSSGATYVESIESNTKTIVDGLTGGEGDCSLGS
jgi:ABC-type Zn uptake system ZnuABC Zn-binding protein ZnuA